MPAVCGIARTVDGQAPNRIFEWHTLATICPQAGAVDVDRRTRPDDVSGLHARRSADAEREAEVDAVVERREAVPRELLDPLEAVAQGVDVDV
jgi:hypothetical protein